MLQLKTCCLHIINKKQEQSTNTKAQIMYRLIEAPTHY